MNNRFTEEVNRLSTAKLSELETNKRLLLNRNMGLCLHCSHEIDLSTVLYLTVNGLPLLGSDTYLLLFSENSTLQTWEPKTGHPRLFDRAFVYDVLDQVVNKALTGHFNFCSCPLDGRLVALIHFPGQLMNNLDDTVAQTLYAACQEIIRAAREEYDMHISVHCSGLIKEIKDLSAAYHRLLNEVTFYHFTETDMSGMITGFTQPEYHSFLEITSEVTSWAGELVRRLIKHENINDYITEKIQMLCKYPPYTISVLEIRVQSFLEAVHIELPKNGVVLAETQRLSELLDLVVSAQGIAELTEFIISCINRIAFAYHEKINADGYRRMQRVEEYISYNFYDPNLTVFSIAEKFHTTSSALNHSFKKYYQDTVYSFLQKKRLEQAVSMLDSGKTIREISENCGFGSVESLYRTFRKEYQMTPKQLQKQRHMEQTALDPESI